MKGGRRIHQPMLTAVAKATPGTPARLGLAISAKAVPRAVDRNRIKRLAREGFRNMRHRLGPFDIVILARNGAAKASRREVIAALDAFWKNFLARPQT